MKKVLSHRALDSTQRTAGARDQNTKQRTDQKGAFNWGRKSNFLPQQHTHVRFLNSGPRGTETNRRSSFRTGLPEWGERRQRRFFFVSCRVPISIEEN